jgi:hypothetical protein
MECAMALSSVRSSTAWLIVAVAMVVVLIRRRRAR